MRGPETLAISWQPLCWRGTANRTSPAESSKQDEALPLETAHLLFMDIVGYSKLLMDQQKESIRNLQEIVLSTEDCRRAESSTV
jgi:hypothetical protein